MLHQTFNQLYEEFLLKMFKAIPKEKINIQNHYDAFKAFSKVNSKAPIKLFINAAHPYAKNVFDKNDDFFLRHRELENGLQRNGMNLKVIGEHWEDLSEASKRALWIYFHNMMIISYQNLGIDTFNKELLRTIIDESATFITSINYKSTDDFPDLSDKLSERYGK